MKLTVAQSLDRHISHQAPSGKALPFVIDTRQGEDQCATPKVMETVFDKVAVT
jgi:hypothetical protein